MCTALEKADDATAASLRTAYVAADATTPEGGAAVATVRQMYDELQIERAYLVRVQPDVLDLSSIVMPATRTLFPYSGI